MSEPSEAFLASLATEPWRPRSLQAPRQESLRLRWRVLILVGITFLHILGGHWLVKMLATDDNVATDEAALVVDLIDEVPPLPLEALPIPVPEPHEPVKTAKPKRMPKPAVLVPRIQTSQMTPASPNSALQALPSPRAPDQLQIYNSEGRLRVPDDMLEQIDEQVGDQRIFSYQIPHIDDARKYFERHPVLIYESTRFEQYWTPDQDLLTELLTKLVEKTTKEIRIPIPGHPDSTMICKVSILALGGGCGILTNGADYVGPLDDPNTLSAEEDRQCQAWWNQIIGANTQDIWRKTRSLYEAQCGKPLTRQQ